MQCTIKSCLKIQDFSITDYWIMHQSEKSKLLKNDRESTNSKNRDITDLKIL